MNRSRIAVVVVIAVALSILGAMASRIFELREVKVERSEGRAAALDPWLALDRALSGPAAARRYSSVDDIDFASAGLVVADGEELAAYDGKAGVLAGWVERGGRLVIAWQADTGDEGEVALPSFPELVPKRGSGGSGEDRHRAQGSYFGRIADVEAAGPLYFAGAGSRKGYIGLSDGKAVRIAMVRSGTLDEDLVQAVLAKGQPGQAALDSAYEGALAKNQKDVADLLKKAGAHEPPPPVVVEAKVLESYVGTYRSEQLPFDIKLFVKEGKLYMQATGQPEFAPKAKSATVFEYPPYHLKFEFDSASSFISKQGESSIKFKKVVTP